MPACCGLSHVSNPNARACFVGLSTLTTQADLVRAVMEGTAMAYRALRDALEIEHSGPLLLAGVGAKSTVWPQILADVLDCEVQVVANPGDAPARGAAIIVGRSLGWFPSYVPSTAFFPLSESYHPTPENTAPYNYLYQLFHSLYPKLKSTFSDLSAFGGA